MVLEDVVVLTLGERANRIGVISVDKFSQHFRFHMVLQLAIDFRAHGLNSYLSVHLPHGVLTMVITDVRGRFSSSSHVYRELVMSVVMWSTCREIVLGFG